MNIFIVLIACCIALCKAKYNVGESYSFESFNNPQRRVCVKDKDPSSDADLDFSEFTIVKGLNGQAGTVSFQCKKNSTRYLRHQNFDLKLQNFDNSTSFKNESSFIIREEKYFPGYVSFESTAKPGCYLRYQDSVMKLSKEESSVDTYRQESSFKLARCGLVYVGSSYSFVSYSYQDYRIGVKEDNVSVGIIFKGFEEFLVVQGLNGQAGSVSFQSLKDKNKYFRHQNFTLKLHRFDNTSLFKNESSFIIRENVFYKDFVAFESANFPGYFLRTQDFLIKLQKESTLESYKTDASFKPNRYGSMHIGSSFSFESYNNPQFRIGANADSTVSIIFKGLEEFTIIKGLNGNDDCVSFQSVLNSNKYLRQQNGFLKLQTFDNTSLFRTESSFIIRENKYFPEYVSFESSKNPGNFLRSQVVDLTVVLQKEVDQDLFRKCASFKLLSRDSKYIGLSYLFGSYNYPEYRVAVKKDNSTAIVVDGLDEFKIVKGLNGRSHSVSLQLIDDQNRYLRHQDFLLKLHRFDNTVLFRDEASFLLHKERYYPGCVSFESTNFPGFFIRHEVCVLKLQQEDIEDELYRKNASFKLLDNTEDTVDLAIH